jgi:glutathione S-transferase
MTDHYTLFGSYACYYTAKTRSYLRKKGIPFVERLPSHPDFRGKVMPVSGTAKVPQILTPEGEVVQDTVEILDYVEARFPDLPAIPLTPRQKVFVHLTELVASEGLLMLAFQHRWLFPEENRPFVRMDIGRSFKPQGTDEELIRYGNALGIISPVKKPSFSWEMIRSSIVLSLLSPSKVRQSMKSRRDSTANILAFWLSWKMT